MIKKIIRSVVIIVSLLQVASFTNAQENKLYISTDKGATWQYDSIGIGGIQSANSFVKDGHYLFAATNNGIFRSTDNGKKWKAVNKGLRDTIVKVIAISGKNLFAGTYGHGIYLSTDNGTSWTAINNGLPNLYVNALLVNGNYLFAGTWAGVFRSSDNGTTWIAVNTGLINKAIYQSAAARSFAVIGNNLFATVSYCLFRTSNNGDNWTAVTTGFTPTTIYNDIVVSKNKLFIAVHGNGIYCSSDSGNTWASSFKGMPRVEVMGLTICGNDFFANTLLGPYHSTDNGASWTLANEGLPKNAYPVISHITSLTTDGRNLFALVGWEQVHQGPIHQHPHDSH